MLRGESFQLAEIYGSIHWNLQNRLPADWRAQSALSSRELLLHVLGNQEPRNEEERVILEEAKLYILQNFKPQEVETREKEEARQKRSEILFFILRKRPGIAMKRAYELTELWSQPILFFNGIVHHQGISTGKKHLQDLVNDRDLNSHVQLMDSLLKEFFLDLGFFSRTKTVDELMEKDAPDQTDLATLQLHFDAGSSSLKSYFFEKCKNPAWFDLLNGAGLLTDPPQVEEDSSGNRVHPKWPQSAYLLNICGQKPEAVAALLRSLPDTDNLNVIDGILLIIMNLPAHISKGMVDFIKRRAWHTRFQSPMIQDRLGEILAQLAKGGEAQAAGKLAEYLLAFEYEETMQLYDWMKFPPDVRPRFDKWGLTHVMSKYVLPFGETQPEEFFKLLCKKLYAALKAKYPNNNEQDKGYDSSAIWRSSIDSPQSHNRGDYIDQLTDALIHIGRFVHAHPEVQLDMDKAIQDQNTFFDTFKRLRLFFATIGNSQRQAFELLTDQDLATRSSCEMEYRALLKKFFPQMDEAQKADILNVLGIGQYPTDTEGTLDEDHKRISEMRCHYTTDVIKDYLPPYAKQRFDELTAAYGEPQPRMSGITSWVGPVSPLSIDEILAMKQEDLIGYLVMYKPTGARDFEASPEGLGREFQAAVIKSPESFAFMFEAIKVSNIPALYIYHFLCAIRNLYRAQSVFDWDGILDLFEYLINEENWPNNPDYPSDFTGGWWMLVQRSCADLMGDVLSQENCPIPFEQKEKVWRIVHSLAIFRDPAPEDDSSLKGDDPHLVAINTTRGEAMNAVISYGLWVARNNQIDIGQAEKMEPRLKELLDARLDPEKEPSPSVRFVYGRRIGNLSYLDEGWLLSKKHTLFPKENPLLWIGAFQGYLGATIFLPLARWLESEYFIAIDHLKTKAEENKYGPSDIRRMLPEHLMVAFAHNGVSKDVILAFFRTVYQEARAEAVNYGGRGVLNQGMVTEEVVSRLEDLWRTLVADATQAVDTLAEFGSWFTSPAFRSEAKLELLLATVERTSGQIDNPDDVIEALKEFVSKAALSVTKIAKLILLHPKSTWAFTLNLQAIVSLLENIRDTGDIEAKKELKGLLDDLGSKGYVEQFRELAASLER